ncbi:hypothetical protein JB92DRAFT_1149046 [Gautieria morchelliformis]|nr:hypothetical protein JB92DRAFT_1149046 [Gautieria morchelliformis]
MSLNDRAGQSADTPHHMPADAGVYKYKEKFFALHDKYEHASAIRRGHEAALAAAQAKLKDLQAECDMLLDTLATEPALLHYLEQMPPAAPAPAARPRHRPRPARTRAAPAASSSTSSAHAPAPSYHAAPVPVASGHGHAPQPPHVPHAK